MTYQPIPPEQRSAFDELLTAEPTPLVHLQFAYNINTDIIEKRENSSGTITQADGMAVIQSGASANSGAHMLSRTPVRYIPGQGALVRFTALFTSGAANSVQIAGVGDVGDGFFFGFNGTAFSILRRREGKPEVQTLTISAGAGTGTGNITITLDSVAKVVAVVQNDTAREVAVKIADADFSDTGLGWTAEVNNATIIFKAWSDGNKAGTFSFTDTDTTGTAGSLAETIAGASTTNEWVAQASWNEDVADGTAVLPSLDSTKGNVFQIRYQWLGFGLISYEIENPTTGKFITVHTIRYANANTVPSLQNPTLPLHVMSKNTSNTSNLTVKTSSMGGFIEGRAPSGLSLLHSVSSSITNLTTTELPILSLKNSLIFQSAINRVRIEPHVITLATEGTKPIIFRFTLNPTLTGTPAFAAEDANTSVAAIDTAASGLTGGHSLFTIILGKADSQVVTIDTTQLNPGEVFTVTAEAVSGSNQEVSVGLSWHEHL